MDAKMGSVREESQVVRLNTYQYGSNRQMSNQNMTMQSHAESVDD